MEKWINTAMPEYKRQQYDVDAESFEKQLSKALRYRFGGEDADSLAQAMGLSDWNLTGSKSSLIRFTLAKALEADDRKPEARVVRSQSPIYLSADGKVKARVASYDDEQRFIPALLQKALQLSTDGKGNPLSRRFALNDYDPETKAKLTLHAIAALNDLYPYLNGFELVSPEETARVYLSTNKGMRPSFTEAESFRPFGVYNTAPMNTVATNSPSISLYPSNSKIKSL